MSIVINGIKMPEAPDEMIELAIYRDGKVIQTGESWRSPEDGKCYYTTITPEKFGNAVFVLEHENVTDCDETKETIKPWSPEDETYSLVKWFASYNPEEEARKEFIAAFVAAITVFEIVQAIVAHAKAKDEIKLMEAKLRAEEARKSAAETEKISQEIKAKLADTLSTLTEEQLAAYNRTLEEARRPVVQYVPVPQFYPWNYEPQVWKVWRG